MASGHHPSTRPYILARTPDESRRLTAQHQLLEPLTRRLFAEAGIASGMRVLDVGSGSGDVALLAAELVGPTGTVVGVELDEDSVRLAAERSRAVKNVRFVHGDLATIELEGEFDAVVGRFVLMHLSDPATILRRLLALLRAGGLVAFQEPVLAMPWVSSPESPALEQVRRLRDDAFARGNPVESQMGLKLHGVFVEVGLQPVHVWLEALIGVGTDWPGYVYIAETMRSLLPMYRQIGVLGVDDLDVNSLAERLRNEIGRANGSTMIQPTVSAWSAKP